METEFAQEDDNELEETSTSTCENENSQIQLNSVSHVTLSQGVVDLQNGNELKSEEQLCVDTNAVIGEEIQCNDSSRICKESVNILSPALQYSESENIVAMATVQSSDLQAKGQMEVEVQLGSLNVSVCNENDGELGLSSETTFPNVSVVDDEKEESSSEDSSSDSESDSSSSSSLPLLIHVQEVDDPDENSEVPLKTKDEILLNELPEIEEATISLPEDVELKPFGTVSSIVEQLVIIESMKDVPPLNEDSVIFKEDRRSVGKIFEIFGPVPHPFYVIRYNTKDQIKDKGFKIKDTMYFAPTVEDFTQYIIPDVLKNEKGSDASWTHDQEPPKEALDYSDDEKERESKQKKKLQNPGKKKHKLEQDQSSISSHEQNRYRRQQNFSRPNSGPRFPSSVTAQENFYGQHHGPFFQTDFSVQQSMQQSYGFHNQGSQDYPMPTPNNGYGSPMSNAYGPHYGNTHPFSAPPPPPPPSNMAWPDPNAHYMQNVPFYPPPPPPPSGNPNHPPFGSHF
ncbi:H/ACA ribonucleoprotein complex non-core subunit NAF1 [Spea bombifrons]|uniref:H/ACA ribonucleoprotein complex non-core subunit NAF1 n=1 Tax=Spea bombifrons TaxID=233779 RepID=UPI0023496334|nr:H/ACA ribonucleoprotein complex non-core subunit NAF1 [Spea bombifrons]